MISYIIFLVFFHGMDYWLFRVYQEEKKIDFENITKFESMMFWPMLLLGWGIKK